MLDFEAKKRQILDRIDILALVGEQVALKRSGKRWVGLCPFHAEKTPSFSVSPDLGIFKCFGCGKGGDIFAYIQLRENIPFMEAMHSLADRAGVSLEEVRPKKEAGTLQAVTRLDIARACAWAQGFFRQNLLSPAGQAARAYIAGRGFNDDIVEHFGLGLACDAASSIREAGGKAGFSPIVLEAADLLRRDEGGRYYETFRSRLMFPIRDSSNRVIGFGGRTLIDDKAKYLNTRQNALFDKGRNLFGIDLARQAIVDNAQAIVVEGYTDCMACHQAGFTHTVASLGTALTEFHVDLIRRYAGEMVIVFDSDQAGISAADRALRVALPRGITVKLARVPEGKDPGEFLTGPGSANRFIELLKGAVEALEFSWRQTWARYHAPTSNARRQEAVLDFVRMVSEAARTEALDAIHKGLLVNQLAHLLRLESSEVLRVIASNAGSRVPKAVSTPAATPSDRAPGDAEQVAWIHLLEVLLNEPGLLGTVSEWPDPSRISDETDRRIAEWVFDCARAFGEFTLPDVLAKACDGDQAARIAELASRGQQAGNFEASFRICLERLEQSSDLARLSDARQNILHATASADADFGVYAEGVRRHKHFGPLRLVRHAASPADGKTATTQTPDTKTNSEPL